MTQTNFSQSGRSMVEMLGTLAIIGVLSVGGIMGYSYGMDKWRASATLNDVNLRMIDLVTQVLQGRNDIALSNEWATTGQAGYPIGLFPNIDNEPSIIVEQVPSSVCKLLLSGSSDTQDIFVGLKSSDQIDGNWYSGSNEDICEGGNKDMLFALNEEVLANLPNNDSGSEDDTMTECKTNADCHTDKPFCNEGKCVECITDSDCNSRNKYCTSNMCEKCPDDKPVYDTLTQQCAECLEDSDCKEAGYYCFGDSYSPDIPHNTLCKKISTMPNYHGTDLLLVSIGSAPDWWNAKKACEIIGMRMPYVTDFYPDWNGERGYTSLTPKDEYEKLLNFGGIGSWATDGNGGSYMVSFFSKHIRKLAKNYLDNTHRITCKPIN